MGTAVSRLHTSWVDGGYDGNPFMQAVMQLYRHVQVVLRFQETKGFVLLPKGSGGVQPGLLLISRSSSGIDAIRIQ